MHRIQVVQGLLLGEVMDYHFKEGVGIGGHKQMEFFGVHFFYRDAMLLRFLHVGQRLLLLHNHNIVEKPGILGPGGTAKQQLELVEMGIDLFHHQAQIIA